jgi:hypothetical protein
MHVPAQGWVRNSDGGGVEGVTKGTVAKLNQDMASLSFTKSCSREESCE